MEGDKVSVCSMIVEHDGNEVMCTEIGEKPKFMLDAEYDAHTLLCAVQTVVDVCGRLGKNSHEQREMYWEFIKRKVDEKL